MGMGIFLLILWLVMIVMSYKWSVKLLDKSGLL